MNFLLINFFLISLLLVTTFFIFKTTSLISVVALTGAFTLLCSAIYVNLDAVDVAFTEAAVGSGISTILMVMAAAKLPEGKKNKLINTGQNRAFFYRCSKTLDRNYLKVVQAYEILILVIHTI